MSDDQLFQLFDQAMQTGKTYYRLSRANEAVARALALAARSEEEYQGAVNDGAAELPHYRDLRQSLPQRLQDAQAAAEQAAKDADLVMRRVEVAEEGSLRFFVRERRALWQPFMDAAVLVSLKKGSGVS